VTFYRRLSLIVAFLLLLGAAVGLAYVYFAEEPLLLNAARWTTDWLLNSSFSWVIVLILVLILVNVAFSVLAAAFEFTPGFSRQLTIEGEGGQISVALDAVEEFLRRKGCEVSGVQELQVNAEVCSGLLAVYCRLSLILDRDIPSFGKEFQGLLRNEITRTLGVQNIKEVRVIIHKMVTDDSGLHLPSASPKIRTEPQSVGTELVGDSDGDRPSFS